MPNDKLWTVTLDHEKDTKNTRKYTERETPGQPPILGTLYLQKWLGTSATVRVTVEAID